MSNVHDICHEAKGVCGIIEVFCEAVVLIIITKGSLVFIIPYRELLPVCPIYALLQSGQMSVFAPDCEYGSMVGFWGVSNLPMVLLVRRAILSSVCLKISVMYDVSFPMYVKEAHFGGVVGSSGWVGLVVWVLWGLMGKELFHRML
jgi:hypothetical protein